jgi:outer membrane protein assembly factor BamB
MRARLYLLLIAAAPAFADWPNFRGPNHDGISRDTGLRVEWTTPLPLLWEREVGAAFSSYACVGQRVLTCGTIDKKQVLLCLQADSGAILWQTPIEQQFRDWEGGDGTRATPTVDADRVYIIGAVGTLLCCSLDDGRVLWQKKLTTKPYWGYSGSVLIEGDMAIVTAGKELGGLAAFEKTRGEPRWATTPETTSYATPYPFDFDGERFIFGFMAERAIIVRAADGKEVFSIAWPTSFDVNAAAPIFHDGYLYLGSGYGFGSSLLKLRREGDKLAADLVWKNDKLLPKFQSSVLYEGHLYTSDERRLKCVEFLTGKQTWEVPRIKDSTIVLAQGHLFLLTEKGELQIAPADPRECKPVTKAPILSGLCWSVPVIHHGRLYARDQKRLVCFKLTD